MHTKTFRTTAAVAALALGVTLSVGAVGASASSAPGDDDAGRSVSIEDAPRTLKEIEVLIADLGSYIDDENGAVADVGGKPSGYASFAVRNGLPAADLYWKGQVPSEITTILDRNPQVSVTVHAADWSLTELLEAKRIARDIIQAQNVGGAAIGPMPDGSGLDLALSDIGEGEAAGIAKAIQEATGVPAFVTSTAKISAASRLSDSDQYSGGGFSVFEGSTNFLPCSTGAGVTGKSTGREYFLTAYHCL